MLGLELISYNLLKIYMFFIRITWGLEKQIAQPAAIMPKNGKA
jgi:hypothetical protein